MPTTIEVLNELKKKPRTPLTEDIAQSIQMIKRVCDSKYSNQSFYGNTALNRKMLLDEEIADHLTPEVLAYLLTNEPTKETQIFRNSTGYIYIKDAICYGFNDGLQVIKLMPNNEPGYGPEAYKEQATKFAQNTLRIAQNINQAAGFKVEELMQPIDLNGLIQQYELIVKTIDLIKAHKKSDTFLYVPGYSPQSMRSQVVSGFERLCEIIDSRDLARESLEGICEKFLQNPEAILDGTVIHLFYDRAHIDAALEQNEEFQIGAQKYTFQAIFREMVRKIATNPNNYPLCAQEQFFIRLNLVESDLKHRFPEEYAQISEKQAEEERSTKIQDEEPQKQVQDDERQKQIKLNRATIVAVRKNKDIDYLFKKIKELDDYGKTLVAEKDENVAVELASLLERQLTQFILKINSDVTPPNQKDDAALQQFKSAMETLISQQQSRLQKHRKLWKPLLANILIALTGIGLAALILNAIIVTATNKKKNSALFNQYAFFGRTNRECKADLIMTSLESISEIKTFLQSN